MKIKIPARGMICESLQGRDKENLYVILQVLDNQEVLVTDGERKKLSCPKKKNVKHIRLYPKYSAEYGADLESGKVIDSQIAFALKRFKEERVKAINNKMSEE
jgi:ribosomal protein L14E/L6E/L27E